MKLIDRDKFISDMFDLYIEQKWKPSDIHFSLLDVRSNIDFKGYEVKAIPIEWIKKWCNEEHNRKSLEERLLKRYGVITMLEDWEKENKD